MPGLAGSGSLSGRTIVVYVVLLGAVLATPALLGPLGRVAGLPFSGVLRLEERLARAAIARDPARTTTTVGALVMGLAMVVALGAVAINARSAATAWLADVVPGDEILTAIAPSPIGSDGWTGDRGDRRRDAATPIASFDLAFAGTRLDAVAIRGADFAADGRLTFTAGDRTAALAAIDAGGAVILPRSRPTPDGRRGRRVDRRRDRQRSGGAQVAGIVDARFPGEPAKRRWSAGPTPSARRRGADAYDGPLPARTAAAPRPRSPTSPRSSP